MERREATGLIRKDVPSDILHLSDDHVSDAFAISFHPENLVFVARGNMELDFRAATIRVIGVSG